MSSTFQVTVRTIDKIWPHPAADRLELGSVKGIGYQFCLQKGLYREGQKVIYFPIDSVLPRAIIDTLGLWGKDENGNVIRDPVSGRVSKTMLVGHDQNRLHTVSLRGQISQGMVCPIEELVWDPADPEGPPEGTDLTLRLGVTKYDPPTVQIVGATLVPLPDGLGEYDIENSEFYPDLTEALMDEKVLITEKLEGVNYALGHLPDGTLFVAQRTNMIIEDETLRGTQDECTHWKVARANEIPSLMDTVIGGLDLKPGVLVALRAELIGPGVQGNHYDLKAQSVRVFDVKVGGHYMDASTLLEVIPEKYMVPVLSKDVTLREWLAGRTLQDASNGKSVLNPQKLREGIVIKPLTERTVIVQKPKRENPNDPNSPIVEYVPVAARAIIKQRSPKYLANEKD